MNLGLSKGLCRSEPDRKVLAIVKRKIAKQPICEKCGGCAAAGGGCVGQYPAVHHPGVNLQFPWCFAAVIAVKGGHKKY